MVGPAHSQVDKTHEWAQLMVELPYLLAFLDRSNIGNAQTTGMGKSLGFSDSEYRWLLTIFYIPYITFEWLALMWKLIPPHIWAFVTVLTWGLASTLQAAAFNWSSIMVCRFFLAVAEAAYAPGIPYLLSFYYMRNELGLRCGIYFAAAPIATCFAGALAYGITSGHAALENWRLLFLVEGLPSIAMAFVAFYFMPDSPEKARFLNEEEKEAANVRAIRQVDQEGADRVGSINFKEVGLALMDVRNWITAEISMPDLRQAAHLAVARSEQRARQLMLGLWPNVDLSKIKDSLVTHRPGHSFLSEPENELQMGFKHLSRRAFSKDGGFSLRGLGRKRAVQYLKDRDELVKHMYGGLHIPSGIPARTEELRLIRWADTVAVQRNIFVLQGRMMRQRPPRATRKRTQVEILEDITGESNDDFAPVKGRAEQKNKRPKLIDNGGEVVLRKIEFEIRAGVADDWRWQDADIYASGGAPRSRGQHCGGAF
ncbi:hypothetical protein V496_00896 [Pseudogymnoascus sp. VKM F-4515 (FW-2607)]|nr:hypothetical protein V496_00896 [Pseudogymnoascus sp. VKM F-4515 (FW-2607)]